MHPTPAHSDPLASPHLARPHSPRLRRGGVKVYVVAVIAFVAVAVVLRYATGRGATFSVRSARWVEAKALGAGTPMVIEPLREYLGGSLRDDLPPEAVHKFYIVRDDPRGSYLFLDISIAREYLDKYGKSGMGRVSFAYGDIKRTAGTDPAKFPVLLLHGTRSGPDSAAALAFDDGTSLPIPRDMPPGDASSVFLAVLLTTQLGDISTYLNFTCIFERPQNPDKLTLQLFSDTQIPINP